jgi:hypothetical protein
MDPKLGGKWDPDPEPDSKKIVTDPQHWLKQLARVILPHLATYVGQHSSALT